MDLKPWLGLHSHHCFEKATRMRSTCCVSARRSSRWHTWRKLATTLWPSNSYSSM